MSSCTARKWTRAAIGAAGQRMPRPERRTVAARQARACMQKVVNKLMHERMLVLRKPAFHGFTFPLPQLRLQDSQLPQLDCHLMEKITLSRFSQPSRRTERNAPSMCSTQRSAVPNSTGEKCCVKEHSATATASARRGLRCVGTRTPGTARTRAATSASGAAPPPAPTRHACRPRSSAGRPPRPWRQSTRPQPGPPPRAVVRRHGPSSA